MSVDTLVTTLKSMKLHGMAGAITELAEQGSPAFKQSGELLEKLIKAEVAEREVRFHQLPDEDRSVPGTPGSRRLRLQRKQH